MKLAEASRFEWATLYSPQNTKEQLKQMPIQRDQPTAWEAANIHLGSPRARSRILQHIVFQGSAVFLSSSLYPTGTEIPGQVTMPLVAQRV